MKNMVYWACSFGLMIFSPTLSQATGPARTVYSVPMVASSQQLTPNVFAIGLAGTSGQVTVMLTNVSSQTQTVTVSILDEVAEGSVYVNTGSATPPSGWVVPTAPSRWYGTGRVTLNRTPASTSPSVQQITLNPNSSGSVFFGFFCVYTATSHNCNNFYSSGSPNFPNATSAAFQICPASNTACATSPQMSTLGANTSYAFRIKVDVAEDRGAIVGSIFGNTGIYGAEAQQPDRATFSLNGGAPF